MRTDQIAELEMMLDDYGLERVLDTIADALERKANHLMDWDRRTNARRLVLQAQALRAQGQALSAGRALTYATQAPLGV